MRWVAYSSPAGEQRIGVVHDGNVHGLAHPSRLLDLLGDDGSALAAAHERAMADPIEITALSASHLQAPIPVPRSIRDFMSFEAHVRNASGAVPERWYEVPVFYFTNPAAVHGPAENVAVPPGSACLDYELEIAAVIGQAGANLTPEQAAGVVAGFLLFCDWSARDLQIAEMAMPSSLGPAKGKDFAHSLGEFFVTADELPFGADSKLSLELSVSVNGREYSRGNTSDGYWTFPEMIAYASRGTRVVPGDIIGSGTLGRGCIAELRRLGSPEEHPWLQPGDAVQLDGGLLGKIDCRIVEGVPPLPLRQTR